jgi:hypothetical protein
MLKHTNAHTALNIIRSDLAQVLRIAVIRENKVQVGIFRTMFFLRISNLLFRDTETINLRFRVPTNIFSIMMSKISDRLSYMVCIEKELTSMQ